MLYSGAKKKKTFKFFVILSEVNAGGITLRKAGQKKETTH